MMTHKDSTPTPTKISNLLTQLDELLLRKTDYKLAFASYVDRVTRVFGDQQGLLFLAKSKDTERLTDNLPSQIGQRIRLVPSQILRANPTDTSAVRVPLYDMDAMIGALHLAPELANDFSPATMEIISVRLSLQLSIILQKCRLGYLIARDPVTEQYNQHEFSSQLTRAFASAKRNQQELSLIALTINQDSAFEGIPQDTLTSHLNEQLRATCRTSDVLALSDRMTFFLAMPNTSPEQTHIWQKRLTQALLASPIALQKGQANLSVTMGCASMEVDKAESSEALLSLATERLQARSNARKSNSSQETSA